LTKGLVKNVVLGGVLPDVPSCNLHGAATFNWLLQFDLAGGSIKTGGAKPISDPKLGYSFVDETVDGFHLQPATLSAPVGPGGDFSAAAGADLILPIYLDPGGTQAMILPMHEVRFFNGKLSANRSCVGKYDPQGFDPDNCFGDDSSPTFLDVAQLDGFLDLEDADTVVIDALSETFCVLLSGAPAIYGDGGSPVQKCKRTNGVIDFHGDWCSATNAQADANCFDALQVAGSFAASSVQIND
jgi:hypothetical protein